MDPFDQLGSFSLQRQKSGQTVCPKCLSVYNNRALPPKCDKEKCGEFLGGTYVRKTKPLDAMMLTSTLASVRLNVTGVPLRVFVNVEESKVNKYTKYQKQAGLSRAKLEIILSFPLISLNSKDIVLML